MTTPGAKIFIVDDDASVRRSLERLLRCAGYAVETFDTPRAFLAIARSLGAGCVVVDVRMPELSGLELQAGLAAAGCTLPLVFITGHGDVTESVKAMKGGAIDFLLKPVDDAQLLDAVGRALQRDARARATQTEREALAARLALLTPREREVCANVARGLLNKEIGFELGISEKTVKLHRARATEKLGVRSAVELSNLLAQLRHLGTN